MNFFDIQNKIEANTPLDFGSIFGQSIELFKKSWMHGLMLQLASMVLITPIMIVFYVPFIMGIIENSNNGQVNPDFMEEFIAGFSVLYIGLFILAILFISVFTLAIRAGFFRMLADLDKGKHVDVKQLFYFFKAPHITKLLVLMFATIGIAIIAMLLCYLPLIYALVPISFFTVVFAFNPELSVSEIIKLSFKIGTKKWLITFGLTLVASLLASTVGFLLCGIGTIVTAPFVYHPLYLVYKEVVGLDNDSPIEEIGTE